jgi:hypothetical protein
VSSAADLWNGLENFSAEILNNEDLVEIMLKDHVHWAFIPMKFKELKM